MIRLRCPHCLAFVELPPEAAGTLQNCGQCRKPMRVPGSSSGMLVGQMPEPPAPKHAGPAAIIRLACPHCQTLLELPGETSGTVQPCRECKKPMRVPQLSIPKPVPSAEPPPAIVEPAPPPPPRKAPERVVPAAPPIMSFAVGAGSPGPAAPEALPIMPSTKKDPPAPAPKPLEPALAPAPRPPEVKAPAPKEVPAKPAPPASKPDAPAPPPKAPPVKPSLPPRKPIVSKPSPGLPADAGIPPFAAPPAKASDRPRTCEEFMAGSPRYRREMEQLKEDDVPDLRDGALLPLPANSPEPAHGYGRPLASIHFRADLRLARLLSRLLAVVLLLGTGALAALIFVLDMHIPLYALIACGAAFLVSLVGVFLTQRSPRTVWVCPRGIVWQQGGRVACCSWEEVEEVYVKPGKRSSVFKVILGKADAQFSEAHSRAALEVGAFIEKRASQAALPAALRRICAGAKVTFGIVALDRDGLTWQQNDCPWSRIVKVAADEKYLYVDTRDSKDLRIPYGEIALPSVVQALARILSKETLPSADAPAGERLAFDPYRSVQ